MAQLTDSVILRAQSAREDLALRHTGKDSHALRAENDREESPRHCEAGTVGLRPPSE